MLLFLSKAGQPQPGQSEVPTGAGFVLDDMGDIHWVSFTNMTGIHSTKCVRVHVDTRISGNDADDPLFPSEPEPLKCPLPFSLGWPHSLDGADWGSIEPTTGRHNVLNLHKASPNVMLGSRGLGFHRGAHPTAMEVRTAEPVTASMKNLEVRNEVAWPHHLHS